MMPDTGAAFTPEICLSDFIQGDGRNRILLGAVSYEPIGEAIAAERHDRQAGGLCREPDVGTATDTASHSSTAAWDVRGDGLNLES